MPMSKAQEDASNSARVLPVLEICRDNNKDIYQICVFQRFMSIYKPRLEACLDLLTLSTRYLADLAKLMARHQARLTCLEILQSFAASGKTETSGA